MTRKFSIVAIVTVITSFIGYLAGAWIIIYALKPEHPEIAPEKLFHEALSHLLFLVFALAGFQLFGFVCIVHRMSRLTLSYVTSIAAEFSGLVAMIHGLLSDFSAFDSIWWQLILGSAPVIIVSTVLLTLYRTRDVDATAA